MVSGTFLRDAGSRIDMFHQNDAVCINQDRLKVVKLFQPAWKFLSFFGVVKQWFEREKGQVGCQLDGEVSVTEKSLFYLGKYFLVARDFLKPLLV